LDSVKEHVTYCFFDNNIKHVLPNTEPDDPCNIAKDIHQVGRYYCNYDYKVNDTFRHVHQPFANYDKLQTTDTLYKEREYYQGMSGNYFSESMVKPKSSTWDNYVKLRSNKFLNSYAMRSTQGVSGVDKETLKKIQDLPVTYRGGTASTMRWGVTSYKEAKIKFSLGVRICWNHKHKDKQYYIPDGGYELVAYDNENPRTDIKQGWRFLSSLPIANKYGSYEKADEYAKAVYEGKIINIDDSLPSAPSINFLPLFKI
jgi:hypothetical protein